MRTLVICSGGLDSVTLAYQTAARGELESIVSFDYGQRHAKELDRAALCAKRLNVHHSCINIADVGSQLTGSALTDDVDVPEGHYTAASMQTTIVPNRNVIMLSIAFGVAVSRATDSVAIAVHGGDHVIYPDCRPEFATAFATMQAQALQGVAEIELLTPYIHKSKADIVTIGTQSSVPFADTWSCYQGREIHCGRCGTCVERREAFSLALVVDPTQYADKDFWRTTLAK